MRNNLKKFNFIKLFLNNVKKSPNKDFIVSENENLTFQDFYDRCIKFKRFLLSKSKKKAPIVCIYETKKPFDYISIIGTVLAGGHYIPINKDIPVKKIEKILSLTNANFFAFDQSETKIKNKIKTKINFITNTSLTNLKNVKKTFIDSKIAYILFTSGTTGEPKGVIINKNNLNYYLKWLLKKIKIKKDEKISQFISISFDVSVCDFYLALCNGSKLFIPDKFDMIFPGKMLSKNKITHLVCTPSLIDHIDNSKDLNSNNFRFINKIFFCGEPLYFKQVKKILKVNSKIEVINAYGPTETTVSVTYCSINKNNFKKLSKKTMSIGKVIDNSEIILVDRNLKINSKEGELLIGGMQLSSGYLKQKTETNRKFVNIEKKRYFKTGDLAFRYKGNLYFKDRIDNQVKFRGHRIELNEINFFLREFGLNNVYTNIFDNELISFIQYKKIDTNKIKKFLKNKIELYKIPNRFIFINKFPINRNGKVDTIKIKNLIK